MIGQISKLILPAALILGLPSCSNKKQQAQQPQQQAQSYPTQVVHAKNVILETSYPATIRGEEDIQIVPQVSGYLDNIYVDEGAVVKKGQRLFSVNSPAAVQGVASAQSSVTTAQANLNTARLNVERIRPLAEQNIISNVQLETYQNQYDQALASLSQAEATLTQANATLGWTRVTSPVDGVVGTIPYRIGSLVGTSTVLTTVSNISNVYAYFTLNEKDLLQLLGRYTGDTQEEKIWNMPDVELTLANDSLYPQKGRIETISGVVNTNTGSVNLRARFPNPEGVLRSGTSGRVTIPREVSDVFQIPQRSTFNQQDKTLVYKVVADSVVQTIITVEDMPDGQTYAVTSGLQEGDTIVTDGIATLSNGKKIQVAQQH